MHDIDARLAEIGIALPEAPAPVASYLPAVRVGSFVQVSGQLPTVDRQLTCTGSVPSQVDIEQAAKAARLCAINALAVLKQAIDGDWSQLVRLVRVGVFVQCDVGFGQQPEVANGASELLADVLGDAGRHARAAVGVIALPRQATVELELTAAVSSA